MSTIVFPELHRSARYLMRKVYAASETPRPAFGPGRPVDRPGDHWLIEVEAPAMRAGCGLAFMADIIQGRRTRIRVPQPDIDPGAVGNPTVMGADQTGEQITLQGLTPFFAVRKGWFLSIVTEGERYTYQGAAEAVADGDGEVTLPIWPMLMVPHSNGDTVEIAEPWIEGVLVEGGSFEIGRPAAVRPGAFTIEQTL